MNMLDETMEELEDLAEASEELMEETEDIADLETAENPEVTEELETVEGDQLKSKAPYGMTEEEKEKLLTHYKRIDLKV
ncbi:hypothetical protein [Butyrivibrio sp. WCE2006]|uniref:hypothetical protein n=1 Tax=Butyrivibrio sp. WCE2006 TaxID=1410611 RepID=UPI000B2D7F48|nr:hypothetical protein [Butyrivibrio sp. WCE2006]